MDDVFFFAAMTALATTVSSPYQAISHRMKREMSAPAFKISQLKRHGDVVVCLITAFPVSHHLRIARITCNGKGIAQARRVQVSRHGTPQLLPAHVHGSRLDVDVVVLATSTSSPTKYVFALSIEPRSSQSEIHIRFHSSTSFFATKYKLILDISKNMDSTSSKMD